MRRWLAGGVLGLVLGAGGMTGWGLRYYDPPPEVVVKTKTVTTIDWRTRTKYVEVPGPTVTSIVEVPKVVEVPRYVERPSQGFSCRTYDYTEELGRTYTECE